MADNRGGYRQPNNPAPVSGPGALSQRTDGGAVEGMQAPATQAPKYMAGLGYGKGGNMEQQSGAAMAGSDIPNMPTPMVPLTAPTTRPEEPVTTGINLGAGAGTEAMPVLPNITNSASNVFRRIAQFDSSGDSELVFRKLADSGL